MCSCLALVVSFPPLLGSSTAVVCVCVCVFIGSAVLAGNVILAPGSNHLPLSVDNGGGHPHVLPKGNVYIIIINVNK